MNRRARDSVLASGLVILIASLALHLAGEHWTRADLTADQRYTLTSTTQRLIGELSSTLDVHAFLPTHVQAPYSTVVRAMTDILAEYQAASDGRIRVHIVDPTDPDLSQADRTELAASAQAYGIKEAELSITQADRKINQRVFFGVALLYQDRQVVVQPIARPESLEYELTRALRDVIRGPKRRPIIGVATGHLEPPIISSPLANLLKSSGDLQATPIGDDLIPSNVDVLLIIGPKRRFTRRQRFVIDQFLMQGKSLVLLIDPLQQSEVFPNILVNSALGIEADLATYGLKIDRELTLLDRTHRATAPIHQRADGRIITVHHPLFAITSNLHPTHPITRGLSSLVLPAASPIQADGARQQGHDVIELVTLAETARARKNVRSIDPAALDLDTADGRAEQTGPFLVAAAVYGTLNSAFSGSAPPPRGTPRTPETPPDPEPIDRAQGEARIVLATSGARLLGANENGILFLQNSIDWAAAETDLIQIRAREAQDPLLREISARSRRWIKAINIVGPAFLLLLLGLIRWRQLR